LHLGTDKEIYRPFDVIFVEGLLFNSMDKKPVFTTVAEQARPLFNLTMELYEPSGNLIHTAYSVAKNAAATFSYKVPLEAKSGDYLIKVYNKDIPTALKYISIRGRPDIKPVEITAILNKVSYSFGEQVTGKLIVSLTNGSAFNVTPTFSYNV
jgi:hypothetical protein